MKFDVIRISLRVLIGVSMCVCVCVRVCECTRASHGYGWVSKRLWDAVVATCFQVLTGN